MLHLRNRFTDTWEGREDELRVEGPTVGEEWKAGYTARDSDRSNVIVGETVGLIHDVRWGGRAIGLDVHREFCEVAICEDGKTRSLGRVPATFDGVRSLAESLVSSDRVALEVTGGCWEVARILEPHVNRPAPGAEPTPQPPRYKTKENNSTANTARHQLDFHRSIIAGG